MNRFTLAIHGGAGTILRKKMTPSLEEAFRKGLQSALDKGFLILKNGGSSLEAVKMAVMDMEDNELFNAGRGSVFTNEGSHEMDASIMEGKNLNAGAVGAVKNIRNPVGLAEKIMLQSGHVFLGGEGALEFARQTGVAIESDDYFFSQFRFDQWQKVKDTDTFQLDHTVNDPRDKKFGTVGAVACDQMGNLAAATSTGGMTNKKFGRMGDTPVIGSGTYANNKTCAISCTGHGEIFLRAVAAYDVSALMEYKGYSLQLAMDEVVNKKLLAINGEGGMIGVDAQGNAALIFNSDGMYRGLRNSEGVNEVQIYR
jgi:beta-aspartyl-peptidase (threonine type)